MTAKQRKPRPPISVRARAADVIDEQRAKLAANLGSAIDGRDPKGVHDMRVASRRLRAAFQVFGPWLDSAEVERLAPAARRITRALGRVREIDVLRQLLAALARRAQPLRAFAIEAVDAQLAGRRRRARARMMKRFARVDLDDFDEHLRRLAGSLREDDARAADGTAAEADPATAGVVTMVDLVRAQGPEIVATARRLVETRLPEEEGTPAAREALHHVRIEAKKLRYVLEILGPTLGPDGKKLIQRLRKLQDLLGDFHDDVVLDEALAEARARAAAKGRERLAAEIGRLRAARKRSLAADERACRREIEALRTEGFADALAKAMPAAEDLGGVAEVGGAEAESVGDAGIGESAAFAGVGGDEGDRRPDRSPPIDGETASVPTDAGAPATPEKIE